MKPGRLASLALVTTLFLAGFAAVVPGLHGALESTSATWTDRTSASAVVTAGAWSAPASNTCTAYGSDGRALPNCKVTSIRFDNWGALGRQWRNYYIEIDASAGARSVTFDVDLTTATGRGTTWSWTNAGVLLGAQFTPRDGWTCGDLPRLKGTGNTWAVDTIYVPIAESPGVLTKCS